MSQVSPVGFVTSDTMTDEEILAQQKERFAVLCNLTRKVAKGSLKSLIVYGGPGTGKSFDVEKTLREEMERGIDLEGMTFLSEEAKEDYILERLIEDDEKKFIIIKGKITPAGLFRMLYENRSQNTTVVFDDCDSVTDDEVALNLLKAALDSTDRRIISWLSNRPRRDGIPDTFEFKGAAIFITNINFLRAIESGSKLAEHLAAMLSRSLYLDLTLDTTRQKMIRIEYVSRHMNMLADLGLDQTGVDDVLDFMRTNAAQFNELSLRKALQIGKLRRTDPDWQTISRLTVLHQ